jgi:hypothetical protein
MEAIRGLGGLGTHAIGWAKRARARLEMILAVAASFFLLALVVLGGLPRLAASFWQDRRGRRP